MIKNTIVDKLEKIILAVITAIFIVLIIISFVIPVKDDYQQIVVTKIGEVKKAIKDNPLPKFPEVNHSIRIKNSWESLDLPAELNDWAMYRPTIYLIEFKEPVKPELKELRTPILKAVVVNEDVPDSIKINWEKNMFVSSKPSASIIGYRIYRKNKSDKDFKLIIELKLSPISSSDISFFYIDKTEIQPETEYQYSLTSISDEPIDLIKGAKNESDPAISNSWITSPEFVRFEAREASPKDNWAYIKVEKYMNGKWESVLGFFKKGDRVGKDKFSSDYEIREIKEEEIRKSLDPSDPKRIISLKAYKITMKNVVTGKERIIETKPVLK
jgi:hypothetical protein